jgi:hypothetical protein
MLAGCYCVMSLSSSFACPFLPEDHVPPVRPYPEDILSCEWYYKQPMAPYRRGRLSCGPSRPLWRIGPAKLPQVHRE